MILRYDDFNESSSSFSSIWGLIDHLTSFSWVKLSIDKKVVKAVDKYFGEGVLDIVRQKSKSIVEKMRSIDIGYIEDRFIEILDNNDYTEIRMRFSILSKHPSSSTEINTDQPYEISFVNQDNFEDIVSAYILISIFNFSGYRGIDYDFTQSLRKANGEYGVDLNRKIFKSTPYNLVQNIYDRYQGTLHRQGFMDSYKKEVDSIKVSDILHVDKCMDMFIPSFYLSIRNEIPVLFSADQAKSDIEKILPSILNNINYHSLIWDIIFGRQTRTNSLGVRILLK